MTTTIADVAKAANVSIATASRVLSKSSHPISEKTRQRVLKSASVMGYTPNWLARGMRTDRTNTIGIIADDLLSPFTPPIIRGIQDYLKTVDYLGLIVNSDWNPKLEREAIRTLLGRSVDGMIFVESGHLSPTEELEQAGKPYMFVHRLFGAPIQHSVVPDDYAGTQLAMEHLFSLGHCRIAHIAGPRGWHSARRRVDGYVDSMQGHGIEIEAGWMLESDWRYEGGFAATQQLLTITPRPTAIYIANDHMAWGTVEAIRSAGLVHHVMPQATAIEALGMSNTQMLENGKLAMAIDGSWALAWIHKISATLGTAALPGLKHPATNMQAHLHSAQAASKHPEEAWRWVRFLSTPFYQTQFCKIGLWLPSQSALMTESGLNEWITEGVHPDGYTQIATEFLPRFGHVLYQPVGWAEASGIINPAMDAVWIGDKTAEAAMAEAVPQANEILLRNQG